MKEGVYLKLNKMRVGAILLAVVILTGAIAGMSFAATDQTGSTTIDALYQNFVSKLAANLGVTQDQVTTALEATKQQMLDEAVQQGKITQEQADKIAAGKGFGLGMFGINHDKGQGRNLDSMASALGITTEQLKTEIQAGKKIQDIVTECGMTMEQFNQKMLELKKSEISQAVADGEMTQEQADKMLQRLEQGFNGQAFGNCGHGWMGSSNENDTSNNNE